MICKMIKFCAFLLPPTLSWKNKDDNENEANNEQKVDDQEEVKETQKNSPWKEDNRTPFEAAVDNRRRMRGELAEFFPLCLMLSYQLIPWAALNFFNFDVVSDKALFVYSIFRIFKSYLGRRWSI